jgi:ribonuclease HI
MHLPSLAYWSIWLDKSNTIFENGNPSPSSVAFKTLGIYKTWNALYHRKPKPQHIKKTSDINATPTRWFDGATQNNGTQSGAGGSIKTSKNTYYKWTFNCGSCTNTRVELLGTWAMLFLASRLQIETLQILRDSRIIIEWLRNKGDLQAISLLAWKDRIRTLQRSFNNLSYKHIFWAQNNTTDKLSKESLQKREGIITYNHWIDGHEGPPLFLTLF